MPPRIKSKTIQLRVTPAEFEAWRAAAETPDDEDYSYTLSEWIRNTLNMQIRGFTPPSSTSTEIAASRVRRDATISARVTTKPKAKARNGSPSASSIPTKPAKKGPGR